MTAGDPPGDVSKPRLRVTMADVAREAGVSGATVSRVLQGTARVSDQTRAAVLGAVRRTGYIENDAARQLAGGSSNAVGLLLRDPRNPAYGLLHSMLQFRTSESGLQLLTVSPSFNRGENQERTGLRWLLALRVCGILVATGVIRSEDLLPFVSAVPTVVLGRPEEHPALNVVAYDEVANAHLLADAVTAHGHRDVAVVAPPFALSASENRRAYAMIDRLRANGAAPLEVSAPTFGAVDDSTPELLRLVRASRVTAVMFPNDTRMLSFLEDARKAGIRVPEDVSLTGVDGIMPGLDILGLTTVRIPVETVARRGTELVHELIAAGEPLPVRHESYQGTLVPGRTLARPPSRPGR